jgi:DNA-binding MarR family transcriptional regulator
MHVTPDECAREVLDVIPLVMRVIRAEMRRCHTPDLAVPQFRTLVFLSRRPGASLSEVAEHLGLTLPSTSRMINSMVGRNLIARQTSASDRRRVTLTPTSSGESILESARLDTQARLADALSRLSASDCAAVVQGLQALRTIFTQSQSAQAETGR